MNLKILCMALFLMTNYALARDPWERYKPCALNQIIQQHAPEQLKALGLEKAVSIISSDPLPSRMKVSYTGESRIVSAKRKELIVDWAKSFRYKPEMADLFESELSFKEGSIGYWLPAQKQLIPLLMWGIAAASLNRRRRVALRSTGITLSSHSKHGLSVLIGRKSLLTNILGNPRKL